MDDGRSTSRVDSVADLHQIVVEGFDELRRGKKDHWDKFEIIARVFTAIAVTVLGAYLADVFSGRQREISEAFASERIRIERAAVLEQFIPGLRGSYEEQQEAVRTVHYLLGAEAALGVGRSFRSGAVIAALDQLAIDNDTIRLAGESSDWDPPKVLLMDSSDESNVYDPETEARGGTNADDIERLIRDLPIRTKGELVGSASDRAERALAWEPDLVVMHFSSFEVAPETRPLGESYIDELSAFILSVSDARPSTRFLIYSRASTTYVRDQLRELWDRTPLIAERLEVMHVTGGSFRNAQASRDLRLRVIQLLDLSAAGEL